PSSRAATPRDPISARDARKRSSRSPAALSGTRCFTHALRPSGLAVRCDERQEESGDTDHDESVGEVEGGPVLEVEKVCDVAEADAVDEVRDAAADHEAERHRQHRVTGAGAREEI